MVATAAPGASRVAGSTRPRQVNRTRGRSRGRESRGKGSGPSLTSGTAAAATETGSLKLQDLQVLAQSTGLTLARVGPTTPQSGTRAGVGLAAIGKVVRRASRGGGFRERPGHKPLDLLLLNSISRFGDDPRGTIRPRGGDERRRGR